MEKNVTRRTVLAGSVATVAIGGSITATDASAGTMAALIGAFQQAAAKYDAAIIKKDELEQALEESLESNPIECLVVLPGGTPHYYRIKSVYEVPENIVFGWTAEAMTSLTRRRVLQGTKGEALASAFAEIDGRERANLASLDEGLAKLAARREASGYTAAEEWGAKAEGLYDEALDALLSHRPASLAEVQDRMTFMTTAFAFKGWLLNERQVKLLFGSMTGGRA